MVGKEGIVIKTEKVGFLPIFKRVYHHRSLEDVVVNITMNESPASQEMTPTGGELISSDGSVLLFDENALAQASDIAFYSSFDEEKQVDIDPFIISEGEVQILSNQALFYVSSSEGLAQDGKVSILFDSEKFSSIEDIEVYKYNGSQLTWELDSLELKEVNGKITFDLGSFGWWALGSASETVYGTLKINQPGGSSTGITPLSDSEVVFSKIEDRKSNEHLFTDVEGQISKYFPIELQHEVSINSGKITVPIDLGFTDGSRQQVVQLDEQVIHQVSAEVFDCELNKQSGFVSVVSGNQYVIKKIKSGNIDVFTNVENENLEMRFYDDDETLLTTRKIKTENINGTPIHFVACDPVLLVETGAVVLQNFEQCKLRVKPIESFIVGESTDNTQFFIAFKGDEVGLYDGLVYYTGETLSFTVADIEKDVKIDIMIYDKISSTIAGFVDGKYKNGEKYKVSFIGNIEE